MNKFLKIIGVFLVIISFSILPLVYSVDFEQVNTTSTQTLTNKILASPTITSPTITGTTTIGAGATLTSPTISGATTIGSGATLTSPTITSPTVSGTVTGSVIASSNIVDGTIVNADVSASAAIVDTKLATISTAGKVSDSALSSNVALKNAANAFTQNQIVQKVRPEVIARETGSSAAARLLELSGANQGQAIFSSNASWDGANWNRDDIAKKTLLILLDPGGDAISFYKAAAGANPITLTEVAKLDTALMKWTSGNIPLGRIVGFAGSIGHDFPSLPAGTSNFVNLTVTGAAIGDFCLVSVNDNLGSSIILDARVISADTITIGIHNVSGAANDPPAATYYVKVIQKDF